MPDLIEVRNLTVAYDRRPAVHHLSGGFAEGSLTAVVGPNGAGKSTLIKTVAGLLRPVSGALVLHGLDRRDIGYLPQRSAIDDEFPIAVQDVVAMGLWRRVGAFGAVTRAMRGEVAAALAAVGLEGFEIRPFGALSAGQRQRVLFARVMASNSRVILLDEPFTAMDARTIDDLLRLVQGWHAEGRTLIVVLHDFDMVKDHFADCLLLARRKVAWGPTAEVMTKANLLEARAMSDAWAERAEICRGAA